MSEHNTDRAQIAALGAANIGSPITGEMVSRQAAVAARIEAQVDATRSAVAQLGLSKYDLLTIDFLTSHFLTMAAELRAESLPSVSDPAQSETQSAPIIAGETQAAPVLDCIYIDAETVKELAEDGFWRTCSGCYDTEDGHPTATYPYSHALGCALGSGCRECGGLGAYWDDSDYEELAADLAADHIGDATEMVAPAVKVKALSGLLHAAIAEAEKAMQKFPQPNYVITKVAEEAGEVVKAAIHCAEGREAPEAVIGEIRQAMAVLIRLYLEGDQVHGLAPLAALEGGDA